MKHFTFYTISHNSFVWNTIYILIFTRIFEEIKNKLTKRLSVVREHNIIGWKWDYYYYQHMKEKVKVCAEVLASLSHTERKVLVIFFLSFFLWRLFVINFFFELLSIFNPSNEFFLTKLSFLEASNLNQGLVNFFKYCYNTVCLLTYKTSFAFFIFSPLFYFTLIGKGENDILITQVYFLINTVNNSWWPMLV